MKTTSESIKEFEKWATEHGLDIETEGVVSEGTTFYSYVDHGTGMACEGWLAREHWGKDDEQK